MSGKLYVCGTPIGNLEDITYRTLKVLNEVDLIAAEDTRHSIKLLNHFEISKPLTSYHEHNKENKGGYLINKLLSGENIALISDAGMPGISDPGEEIIKQAIENDIEVIVLPGPTASITALIGSGLETGKFVFEGFLDRDKKRRREELELIKHEKRTIIFYESPHRLKDTLKDMLKILGNRNIAVNRELTKKYQEVIRTDIQGCIDIFNEREVKGEFVLIVEGFKGEIEETCEYNDLNDREYVIKLMEEGITKKDAIKFVCKERKLKKDIVYKQVLDLE
ncbi:MAG: 16S rRNA (cytidine(1402)-2'-O)-methyltransferase [Paraclostridium sordellii]